MLDEYFDIINKYIGFHFGTCKRVGYPYKVDHASNILDLVRRCEDHGYTDVYVSIHNFDYPKEPNKFDQSTAIINCLAFDFDIQESEGTTFEDVRADMLKLSDWAYRHSAYPLISFSGKKGGHIRIPLKPLKLTRPKETLHMFFDQLCEAASFKTIDTSVTADIERILRVPNTVNSKSNLWCIPLTYDELKTLSHDEISELARFPRSIQADRIEHDGEIIETLKDMDTQVEPHKRVPPREKRAFFPQPRCCACEHVLKYGTTKGYLDNVLNAIYYRLEAEGIDINIVQEIMYAWIDRFKIPRYANGRDIVRSVVERNSTRDPYSYCTFFLKSDPATRARCEGCTKYASLNVRKNTQTNLVKEE